MSKLNNSLTPMRQENATDDDDETNVKQTLFVLIEDGSLKLDKSNGFALNILWQIIPASLSCLLATCFGIILGWPSPTYPQLLAPNSPIPLTLDQTAMIAGFLMLGNVVSTPFSTWSYAGNKYGMVIGMIATWIGWLLMWQARNVYWLLASRFVIGLGSGFGLGQLKLYVKEMCQSSVANVFKRLVNIYLILGVVLVYSVGPYVHFRTLSLIATIVCLSVTCICSLLPHTPHEYLRMNRVEKSKKLLRYLQPANVEVAFDSVQREVDASVVNLSLGQILKRKETCRKTVMLTFLLYLQQFTGAPATVVYSQIIFDASKADKPELCAIVYAITLLFSNLFAAFSLNGYGDKWRLLFSSVSVSIVLTINVFIIHFDCNELYWNYITFVLMLFYIFFHTIGLGTVPAIYLEERFEREALDTMSKGFWMLFSALALLITKIFQVLYERYDFYIPFCLFLCNSIIAVLFTLIFYPDRHKRGHKTNVAT